MSLSLVRKGLKQLDNKYSIISVAKENVIDTSSSQEKKKKRKKKSALPSSKVGLKKVRQELRYCHSKSYIEKKRLSDSKTLSLVSKPIDLVRQEKASSESLFESNVQNLLDSRITSSDRIQDLHNEVLNYDELYGPKPIRRLKKRARQVKAASRY